MDNAAGADLLSIGEHCSHASCHQNDFLPFTCDCCKRVFCLEHRTYTAHSCTAAEGRNSTIIVCPLCAKAVKLPPGSDVHAVFEAHTREGACDPTNYDKVHKRPKCPAAGCKEKLSFSNTYECKTCLLRVCLKHRHGDDHGCAAVQAANKAAAEAARTARNPFSAIFRRGQTSPTLTAGVKPNSAPAVRARAHQQYADPANSVKGAAERRHPTSTRQGEAAANSATAQQRPSSQPGDNSFRASSAPGSAPPPHTQQAPSRASQQPSGSGAEECPQCRARFTTINQLIQHVEDYHPSNNSTNANTSSNTASRNNNAQHANGVEVCDLTGDGRGGGSVSNPAWWATSPSAQQQQQQQQGGRPAASSAAAGSSQPGRAQYEFACPRCQRGFRDAVNLVRHTESGVCVPQAASGKKQDGCTVS